MIVPPDVLGDYKENPPRPLRVAPTRRWTSEGGWSNQAVITASRQTECATSLTTIDQRPVLQITELWYPGDRASDARLAGKWAYVFNVSKNKCIVEAIALEGDPHQWDYRTGEITPDSLSDPFEARSTGGLIDVPPKNEAQDLWAFLSPIRLSPRGLSLLLDEVQAHGVSTDAEALLPLTRFRWNDANCGLACVPDPFSWAADAQLRYHIPSTDNWLQFTDANKHHLFVASVLQIWLDSDGPSQDIRNNLRRGQPGRYLSEHKKLERRYAYHAERAAGYLVECLDAAEHRAVEVSGDERGGSDRSACLQHWAIVTQGLSATRAGQTHLRRLIEEEDRAPRKYVFSEDDPFPVISKDEPPPYETYRFAYLAMRQIVCSLMSAWFAMLAEHARTGIKTLGADKKAIKKRGLAIVHAKLNRLFPNRRIESFPEGLELRVRCEKARVYFTKLMFVGLKDPDTDLGSAIAAIDQQIAALESKAKGLEQKSEDWKRLEKSDLGKLMVFGEGIVECINTCTALLEALDARGDAKTVDAGFVTMTQGDLDVINAIGAVADAVCWAHDAAGAVTGRQVGKLVARCVGFAAVIGGVCDTIAFTVTGVTASKQHNIGEVVGASVGAVGSLVTVVAGAWAIASGSLTTGPGVVIGCIGATLVTVGSVTVMLASRNVYEKFAQFCFLGLGCKETAAAFDEFPGPWPDSRIEVQAQYAELIMATFRVEAVGMADNYRRTWNRLTEVGVTIKPGYYPRDASMDIRIEYDLESVINVLGKSKDATLPANWLDIVRERDLKWSVRLRLEPDADEPVYQGTPEVSLQHRLGAVVRSDTGRFEQLTLMLNPTHFEGIRDNTMERFIILQSIKAIRVYVQIRFHGIQAPAPAGNTFCMLDVLSDFETTSLDSGSHRTLPLYTPRK